MTWLSLLVMLWSGIFEDRVIIAILMGESVLGVFYIMESLVKEELKVFRLPFLLTMITVAYFVLTFPVDILSSVLFLGLLWILFFFIYKLKTVPSFRGFVKKLVECCRRW